MGGCNERKFMRDWHLLDCTTWTWNTPSINLKVPFSLNPSIFWNGGRGLLVQGDVFHPQKEELSFHSKLYQFIFEDNMTKIRIDPVYVTEGHRLTF